MRSLRVFLTIKLMGAVMPRHAQRDCSNSATSSTLSFVKSLETSPNERQTPEPNRADGFFAKVLVEMR